MYKVANIFEIFMTAYPNGVWQFMSTLATTNKQMENWHSTPQSPSTDAITGTKQQYHTKAIHLLGSHSFSNTNLYFQKNS